MAKSQNKSGRETRKAKAAAGKTKDKLPRYLSESDGGQIQIPTGRPATGKPTAKT